MNRSVNLSPKAKKLLAIGLALSCIVIALFVILNKRGKHKVDPAFSKYIESYTTGVISRQSAIRIKLSNQVQTSHAKNEALKDGVFDLSPSVKGKAYWVDAQTIEFKPDESMQPDKAYEVEFELGDITDVPGDLKEFKFSFETIKPDFTVEY